MRSNVSFTGCVRQQLIQMAFRRTPPFSIHVHVFSACQTPEVMTQHGTISGSLEYVSSLNVEVEHFLGIPFAKPPIGQRRFANPEPYGDFPGGKICYSCLVQYNVCGVTLQDSIVSFSFPKAIIFSWIGFMSQ